MKEEQLTLGNKYQEQLRVVRKSYELFQDYNLKISFRGTGWNIEGVISKETLDAITLLIKVDLQNQENIIERKLADL
jgi:hypothetical protein